MKKLKKLTRNELKTVGGAGIECGPFPCVCIYTHEWCEYSKKCIPKGIYCGKIPTEIGN